MKTCPKCQINHSLPGIYCSRKCANSRQQTQEVRMKKSKTLKGKASPHRGKKFPKQWTRVVLKNCTSCAKSFYSHKLNTRYVTYCSDECYLSIKRKNALNHHKVEYNGITMDSSWEVDIAKFLDANYISWVRPKTSIPWMDDTGKQRKYFPDFFLPEHNLYLDPKNPIAIKTQHDKLEAVSKTIDLLYGEVDHIKQQILARIEGLEPSPT